jgi:hypothetical protein
MILIASICFALFFVEIHRFHDKWKINFKPFNCASCLASWMALLLWFVPVLIEPVFLMFVAGTITPIARLLMNYIWKKL